MCWPADGKAAGRWFQIYFSLYLSQSPSLASSNYVCTHTYMHTGWMCAARGAVLLMRNIWFARAHAKSLFVHKRVKRLLIESKPASARCVCNCALRLAPARAYTYIIYIQGHSVPIVIVVHLGVQYLQSRIQLAPFVLVRARWTLHVLCRANICPNETTSRI